MSLVASVFALALVQAQADPIDAFILQTMEQQKVPGMAVLIKKGDRVIKRKAYGVASVELEVPFKETTVYETGSIGKTFTALAVMKLVEEGKLSLDDKLKKSVPETPDAWAHISLKQLITHTSGIPEYVLFDGLRLDQNFEAPKWWEVMSSKPLDFVSGSQFQYSNSNFYLLALVIEKVSGKNFEDYVDEVVIKPCGLKNTLYRTSGTVIAGIADGYFNFENRLSRAGLSGESANFGAGGLASTVDDTALFLKAVHDGKVVSKATLAKMQEPNRLANGRKTIYGYGWFVRSVNQQPMVSHAGNCVGYSAGMAYFPKQDLTVALGANVYAISGDNLAIRLATLLEPDLKPKKPVAQKDPTPELSDKLIAALKALGGGDTKHALFDKDMQERLSTPRGQMGLPGFRQYAQLDKFEFCGTENDDPDTVYIYRLFKGERTFVARFTVTKDKLVYTVGVSVEEAS